MRVDVVDLVRADARVAERHLERRHGPGRIGIGDVLRVGGQAVAGDLRVDLRAARLRVLELFEHEQRARLAHHEAVPPRVERPRSPLGVVIAPREGAHRAEARDAHLAHRRLGTAAEHHVGATQPDRVRSVTDRHVRGGTRRALGEKRPARAELDRDPAGAEVRDDRRDRERIDPVRARGRRARRGTPGTTAGRRCRSRPPRRSGRPPCSISRPESATACRAAARIRCVKRSIRRACLAVDPVGRVEVLHLAGEVHGIVAVVEVP